MKTDIVYSANPVTLVGGGTLFPDDLARARALASLVIAADGGANSALEQGVMPKRVIGDLDSISPDTRQKLGEERLLHVAEQDTTDFHKALRSIEAPVVLAVGFLGARVDHQLAALHVLVQPHTSPAILIGEHEILFHLRAAIHIPCAPGEVVSLFPMQEVSGRSTGLEWPIDGLTLSPMGQIGTSNRAQGPVWLEAEGEGLVVILAKRHLEAVMAQLAAAP